MAIQGRKRILVKGMDRHGSSCLAIDEKVGLAPGYLAKALETEGLAYGIAWVLAQRATGPSGGLLGQQARVHGIARLITRYPEHPSLTRRHVGVIGE